MNTVFKTVLVCTVCLTVPAFGKTAKAKTSKRRTVVTAKISPSTGKYEKSSINFNRLIKHENKKQARLEKRVKTKFASRKPAKTKVSRINFDDSEMKWKPNPKAEKTETAPRPQTAATAGQPGAFTVTLRSKNSK